MSEIDERYEAAGDRITRREDEEAEWNDRHLGRIRDNYLEICELCHEDGGPYTVCSHCTAVREE